MDCDIKEHSENKLICLSLYFCEGGKHGVNVKLHFTAKENFKSINKNNMKCSLGCDKIENQEHIFQRCSKLKTENSDGTEFSSIFENVDQQKRVIQVFIEIDNARNAINLLPGEAKARTHASHCTMQQTCL